MFKMFHQFGLPQPVSERGIGSNLNPEIFM